LKPSKTSRRSSNGTSGRPEPRDLRKTLDPRLLARAKAIADQYTIALEPNPRVGFMGTALEFPTVFISAKGADQCVEKLREALMVAVAVMLEAGEAPPMPATEERRDQQINIRLTSEEKALLENLAKRRGFRGISDLVRTAALSETRKAG
jgi:predicted RNase H-like HicB family nuclease